MLPLCVLLFGLSLTTANDFNITNFEVPSSVRVGENAELHCEYEVEDGAEISYIKWFFTPLHTYEKKLRYQRVAKHTGVAVDSHGKIVVKDKDTIQLMDMQMSESGTYECEIAHNFDEKKNKGTLIVYTPGSGPMLNITIMKDEETGDEDALVTCSAEGVAPEPEMAIFIDGIEKTNETSQDLKFLEDGARIAANVTVEDAISPFHARCVLYYKDKRVVHPDFSEELAYTGSGPETTTIAEEAVQEGVNATALPDGSVVLHWSWLSLVAAAALAHVLA